MMDLELRGKVVVVTGASTGIGLGVARAFAGQGAHLVVCARREERLRNEAEQIAREFDVRCLAVPCDVATTEGTAALVDATGKEFGGLDILINNAGSGSNEKIMDAPDAKWNSYWDLHVMAAVRLARGFVPMMRMRAGGVIVNNGSICAAQPLGYEPIYNVTKAALQMFSRCLAGELIGDNIRVNTINPGLVLTPDWVKTAKQLTASTGGDWQGHLNAIARDLAPINRFASVEELADFFLFLCSPRASFCVGGSYFVDGGQKKTV
jgi:NAD(P)-dependent dehydrogenase (short-subunit alcohol dehydrogenase family)